MKLRKVSFVGSGVILISMLLIFLSIWQVKNAYDTAIMVQENRQNAMNTVNDFRLQMYQLNRMLTAYISTADPQYLFYTKLNDKSYRFYTRDDLSIYGGYTKGANYQKLDFETKGVTLNYETDENNKFRFGVYSAKVTKDGQGTAGNFALQMAPSGSPLASYPYPFYQPDGALDKSEAIAFTVGMDYGFGDGYRLTSELAMRNMIGADTGPNAQSGYISVSKKIDKWTPYVTVATLRAKENVKDLYDNLDSDPINNVLPVNRQYADMAVVSEQNSYTVGTSYSITPLQKIKAEWMHVDVGSYSNFLIDNPNTERMEKQTINVYSLSYNVAF